MRYLCAWFSKLGPGAGAEHHGVDRWVGTVLQCAAKAVAGLKMRFGLSVPWVVPRHARGGDVSFGSAHVQEGLVRQGP